MVDQAATFAAGKVATALPREVAPRQAPAAAGQPHLLEACGATATAPAGRVPN